MTYKVLIVEDEKEKARGIAYLIGKYNPECTPVLLAYDGKEGYEKAISECPDIILSDIKMPVMDGLEMIRTLVEAGVSADFIVLSGYAEFNYAKKAIELGVRDFITKPVDEEELRKILSKVCREIAERRATSDSIHRLNDDMRNYALRDFLAGGMDSQHKVGEYLEQMGIDEKYGQYTCMMIEWDEIQDHIGMKEGLISQDGIFSYGVKTGDRQMAVVIGARSLNKDEKKLLIRKRLAVEEQEQQHISVGIGSTYENYIQLPKAYEEARVALNYRILKGNGTVILFEELYDMENRTDLITVREMEQLKERIDRFDQDGFYIAVKKIFQRVLSENNLSLSELQKLSLNMVLIGLHNIPTAQLQMNEYFGKNLFTLESIEKFKTIEQLENWIMNMVSSMNELMLKDSVPRKKDVIAEAKEYIRRNYNQNITLNDISKQFYINPYYFSQLFKKKTGMTYQKYLTDYRVDRAKKLLAETELRIYEVCNLVGYSDVNHFNQIFERSEGMRPSEYRQQFVQEDD